MGRIFGSMGHGFHSAANLGGGASCPDTATLFDSNETTNQNYGIRSTSPSFSSWLYQSFTGGGCVLDSISLFGFIQTGYSGNMTIHIQAHTGTYGSTSEPTGSALAVSDSGQPWSTNSAGSWGTWNFTGGNRITLTEGTYYCFTLQVPYYSGRYVYWKRNTTSVHDGNTASGYVQSVSLPTTQYTPAATYDMTFRLYHMDV